jgi:hypothetical protein
VLSANGKKAWHRLEKTVPLGELALDGRVRPVNGVLSAVLAADLNPMPGSGAPPGPSQSIDLSVNYNNSTLGMDLPNSCGGKRAVPARQPVPRWQAIAIAGTATISATASAMGRPTRAIFTPTSPTSGC